MTMKTIPLTQGQVSLVDDEDYQALSTIRWYYMKNQWGGYVSTRLKGKTVYLHRLILNAPKGMLVDHINYDGLDNRRNNIRLCSYTENSRNKRIGSKNTSGYKGVSFHKAFGKFYAYIQVNHKLIQLGYFDEAKDAAKAYRLASRKYFGSFATS